MARSGQAGGDQVVGSLSQAVAASVPCKLCIRVCVRSANAAAGREEAPDRCSICMQQPAVSAEPARGFPGTLAGTE